MWDIGIDRKTGDLIFGGNHDLQPVHDDSLLLQRVLIRLKIERGSWIYDPSGKLGSRLSTLLRRTTEKAVGEVESIIREALEPMQDVVIQAIKVERDMLDENRLNLKITLSPQLWPGLPLVEEPTVDLTIPFMANSFSFA